MQSTIKVRAGLSDFLRELRRVLFALETSVEQQYKRQQFKETEQNDKEDCLCAGELLRSSVCKEECCTGAEWTILFTLYITALKQWNAITTHNAACNDC